MAAALLAVSGAVQAQSGEPPRPPILRVEPGMHVNVVRGVAVDAAGRWAVTASDDRTARVWQVATGAAGPVLRVPLAEGGQGGEGRLQAVAITPDGNTVAVAGRSGSTWGGNNAVYVFDRASGRMLRRIETGSALPVVTLALTPDGRYLAAGLGDEGGLRVFDFASGALLHSDPQYAASIYALDFRADGRVLVAGAADGALRVYLVDDGRLRQAGKVKLEAGVQITQARFSPDGELIAVGLEDSPVVLVLDGRTLKVVGRPAPAADGASAFSSLAWSPDGRELWGGGTHRSGGQWQLRVWPRADWARFADRPVAGASVLALATLPGQRVLFVSGEPAWGIVDVAAQVQRRVLSPLASFNGMARQFQVSADGRKLRYWYGFREPVFEFDLATRAIRPVDDAGSGLQAARTEAPGLRIEGWENRRGPGFNGRRLPLGEFETSRSLAIAADGQRWVLGTDERLWMFDAAGKTLWNQRVPSLVWAVNLSADGKLVLAAGQDGTIRWYRASDGAELLALLPHADRRRWVMWTPSGYFDAAAGAEELLGWHVNRDTKTAPDFFPMSTLRERFRRPDVVDRVLQTADEAVAVQQALAASGRPAESGPALQETLPPVLELGGAPEVVVAAGGNANEARLKLRIRTLAQAPVTALRARADGRPAVIETTGSPTRNATAQSTEERTVTVRFAGQPQQLQLMAENRNGLSAAVTVQVQWPVAAGVAAAVAPAAPAAVVDASVAVAAAPAALLPAAPAAAVVAAATAVATPPAAATAGIERAPRLFVLAIGVGKFKSTQVNPLDLPTKDA
ncbi:MAG: WD40 repeat domain-containing protein, partial [Bacteroidia bacterium]